MEYNKVPVNTHIETTHENYFLENKINLVKTITNIEINILLYGYDILEDSDKKLFKDKDNFSVVNQILEEHTSVKSFIVVVTTIYHNRVLVKIQPIVNNVLKVVHIKIY